MKIVIVGNGKLGSTLSEQLVQENHELTIIDTQSAVLEAALSSMDVRIVQGNGASYEIQMEAGVPKADLLLALTASDELNMLCCIVAKKLGAKYTIARVRNPEYSKQSQLLRDELGLSMVINPDRITAEEIVRNLRYSSAINLELFARGRTELIELKIGKQSPFAGKTLSQLGASTKPRFLICAVQRGGEVYIPTGNFRLEADDYIHVTATPENMLELFRYLDMPLHKFKNAMIIGGGRITIYLTRQLIEMGVHVTIIEKDEHRCQTLCEYLPKAMVINGDGTDIDLLQEEGIAHTDLLLALTGIDEQNIIISMYAQHAGKMRVMTKIDHIKFPDLLHLTGIDSVISPVHTTATQIIRFVRATANSLESGIETLHKLVGGRVEAMEFIVRQPTEYLDKKLRDLPIKPDVLIPSVIRGGISIIPNGDTTIQLHDHVVAVSKDSNMNDLRDIFR